jgi:hypothetical protein
MKTYHQYGYPPKNGKIKPFKVYRSTRPGKKLMVKVEDGKRQSIVHFGDTDYQDYTQHKNKTRRENYLKRTAGIKDKNGNLTKDDPFSANFWSRKILWNS